MGGNVIKANDKLLHVFGLANKKFFSSALQTPEITIQSAGRRSVFGWCSNEMIWKSKRGNGFFEINISAEYLARPVIDIIGTLLHEMAHLYCSQNGIRDCSSNQYHNKHFKTAAEMAGLMVSRSDKRGWSETEVSQDTKIWIESLSLDERYFSIYRSIYDESEDVPEGEEKEPRKKGSKLKKWSCDCTNIRCATKLKAICVNCKKPFIKEKDED